MASKNNRVHKNSTPIILLIKYKQECNSFVTRHSKELISQILKLRSQGRTYGEINKVLNVKLAKSSLHWICKDTPLPSEYATKITLLNISNLGIARATALAVRQVKKDELLMKINEINLPIAQSIINRKCAKIALSMLCLGEASKAINKTAFCLGSSDHRIITLFIILLQYCFSNFDSHKLRATVQCRSDQDTNLLMSYWQNITKIPFTQFYKPLIDPRTIGKPTKKKDYKGVLNVYYLDRKVQLELESLANLVYNNVHNWALSSFG